MDSGNADAAIGFFIVISIFAIMFVVEQAKIDRIREEGRKRIADIEADHERRMDEFQTANPTASCTNCMWVKEFGSCGRGFHPRRHYCLQWSASHDHDEALEIAALSDRALVAKMSESNNGDLSAAINHIEDGLMRISHDPLLLEQGQRALRLARKELARLKQEGVPNA